MGLSGFKSAETLEEEDEEEDEEEEEEDREDDRTFTVVAESSFGLQLGEDKNKKDDAQIEEERKSFA